MEFKNIALLITENCNARCKMCCDSRGEVCGKTVSSAELDFILNNIKGASEIESVGITGGEPMLYPEIVERILNYDFGRSMSITLKTNGFWGKNIVKTESFIQDNKDKLSYISLSYDAFHKEFIHVDYLINIIKIAAKYGVHTEVVGCFLKNGAKPGDILNDFGEAAYYTDFCYQPVIKTGSACCFENSELIKLLSTDDIDIRCVAVSQPDILINAKLDVFPCCSQVIENTILEFGNLNDSSLNNIISDIKHNKILFTIFTEGFTPFIDFMNLHGIKYPHHLASPCELCAYLFESDWFLKELQKYGFY